MIERVQIQNFQLHEKLRVLFDENITTIVGPSDTGKSSILRAIRWVAFNRPLGDGFIRTGETSCSVKLWVDGVKIERRKSKGKNSYFIDGKKLSAVGTSVPEEIQRALNLNAENFQTQHEPMFWFSLTPGEIGKRLNAIVDLEVIDSTAAYLNGKLRKAKIEQEVIAKRLETATEERDRLAFADDMAEDFGRMRGLHENRKKLQMAQVGLRRCLDGLKSASQRRSKLRTAVNESSIVLEAAGALELKLERLSSLSGALEDIKRSKERADRLKSQLAGLQTELDTVETCPTCGKPI